jgi:Tol biopolymer transport system component
MKFLKITTSEEGVFQPTVNVTTTTPKDLTITSYRFFDIYENKIAFIGSKNNKRNIFIKDLGGSKAVQQRTFKDSIGDVSFSPDGKQIAFSDFRGNNWDIYMIDAEQGAAVRQLTTSNLNDFYPAFSPDGNNVFFIQREEQQALGSNGVYYTQYVGYLWALELNKNSLVQYAKGWEPSFLPEGNQVIVTRDNTETGKSEIWLLDLDKGQEYLVLNSNEKSYRMPAVSPDGKKIVFCSSSQSESMPLNYDISMINIDGSNMTQLTFHPGDDVYPYWSHDGKNIFFLSQRGSEKREFNIWMMELHSSLASGPAPSKEITVPPGEETTEEATEEIVEESD